VLEWLFAFLEAFQERHLEPQTDVPECVEDAWLWYRVERLERRVRWLFLLVLVVPIVEATLFLLWLIVSASTCLK
jgi:hypothetical protein